MKQLHNYTPHILRLRFDENNNPEELASDLVLRSEGRGFIETESETEGESIEIEGHPPIPVAEIEYGEIEGLPDPQPGHLYIVSMPAAQYLAARGRKADIRYPDTGKDVFCVRDEKRLPFATRRLLQAKVK